LLVIPREARNRLALSAKKKELLRREVCSGACRGSRHERLGEFFGELCQLKRIEMVQEYFS
jgi:hypothetical protein